VYVLLPLVFDLRKQKLTWEADTLNVPNYTGSTGFGEFYVQKLVGHCGTLDVEDVKATVDHLVKEGKGEYGPGKLFVTGGSHGGFLTAHRESCYSPPDILVCLRRDVRNDTVIGQYPETFSAAVLRNPVISSQPASTDIPDWYFSEFGVRPSVDAEQMLPELYAQLYLSSPISHVRKVCAPVLLLLGTEDRRVINVQGKGFFHALRALGREVELLTFEGEGHSLDGVETARVGWTATVDWFGRKA